MSGGKRQKASKKSPQISEILPIRAGISYSKAGKGPSLKTRRKSEQAQGQKSAVVE
jgi:hypothetical protein